MKNIIKITLLALLLTCLCACSSSNSKDNTVKNELANIIDQGYEVRQTSYQDNKWQAIYELDGNYKDAYKVELTMNQETFDKLFELDILDEEQLKQFNEIVTSISDCTLTPMSDLLHDENEVMQFVGKTIKDLEDAGYERMGNLYYDDGCVFFADGPFYSLNVKTDEVITFETMDNYSENDIRALTISGIEISGFSSYIFD